MAKWPHFQSLWEDFGVGRGRLISKYPLQWAQRVAELAKQLSPPVRATAIASKIYAEQHKFIVRVRPYDGTMGWLENAVDQMARNPFDAIIAKTNLDWSLNRSSLSSLLLLSRNAPRGAVAP